MHSKLFIEMLKKMKPILRQNSLDIIKPILRDQMLGDVLWLSTGMLISRPDQMLKFEARYLGRML
jgi:hypothetical protein